MKKLLCILVFSVFVFANCDEEVFDFSKTCLVEQELEDSEFIKAINKYRQDMGLGVLKSKPSSDKINTSVVTGFVVNKYENLELTLKAVLSNVNYKQVLFASFYDSVCFEENDKTIKILLYSDKINKECSLNKEVLHNLINQTQSNAQVVRGLCNVVNQELDIDFLPKQSHIIFVGEYDYIVKDGKLLGYPISIWGGDEVKIYQNDILVDTDVLKSTKVNENFFEIYPKQPIYGAIKVEVDKTSFDFNIQKSKGYVFLDIKDEEDKTIYLKKDSDFYVVPFGVKDFKLKLLRENKNFQINLLSDNSIKIHTSNISLDNITLSINGKKVHIIVLEKDINMGVFYDDEGKISNSKEFINNGFFVK